MRIFKTIAEEIKSCALADYSIVVSGDFNVIFDQDLDGSGGVKKKKGFSQIFRRYLFRPGFS